MSIEGINWNRIQDDKDKEVWDRLVNNFWVPEKVPLSNDVQSWATLTESEKLLTMRVFTGLTLLDTIQGTVGAMSLMPDAITPHEEAVYANISFMERFAGGTEVLTPEGWIDIKDVTEETQVMQYDPVTNQMQFTKPVKVYEPEWRPKLYEIAANNGNARQVVSAGHRVYYEEKLKKNNSCDEWQRVTCEAEELLEVNLNTAHRRFRSTGVAVSGRGMSNIDRLLVAISADGSYSGSAKRSTGEKTGCLVVTFSFQKERKLRRLLTLANLAGWKTKTTYRASTQKYEVRLWVPLEYSKGYNKRFSDWWSYDQTSDWAQDFIDEVGHWDGHKQKGGTGVTYYTTDKSNSDFTVAMASLAGFRSRTTMRQDDRSENFNNSYVTNVTYFKDTVSAQSMKVTELPGGVTYCIQVPSTYLLTRNGESTVITGNCVHAKSYSSIFSTLCSTEQIDEAFRWARENPYLQAKAQIINSFYIGDDPLKKKIASTLLESFLFYSGFYLPLYWSTKAKLTNTADIIRLIIRDEAVHGYYIGYKFQKGYEQLPEDRKAELKDFTFNLLYELYENEVQYTQDLYDGVGLTEDVKKFLHYNANKALMNLGFDAMFPKEVCDVTPAILSSLSPNADENHDFFSGSGSSYVIGKAEATQDDDWDF